MKKYLSFEHKGYKGDAIWSNYATCEGYFGHVNNIRDVVTFQGDTAEEVKQAFIDSVDDYLEFCKEQGAQPCEPGSKSYLKKINLISI